MSNPTGKGGFRKGESGNRLGRPKAVSSLALEARKHALLAIGVLTKGAPRRYISELESRMRSGSSARWLT
jgi:hypothetical protein